MESLEHTGKNGVIKYNISHKNRILCCEVHALGLKITGENRQQWEGRYGRWNGSQIWIPEKYESKEELVLGTGKCWENQVFLTRHPRSSDKRTM